MREPSRNYVVLTHEREVKKVCCLLFALFTIPSLSLARPHLGKLAHGPSIACK